MSYPQAVIVYKKDFYLKDLIKVGGPIPNFVPDPNYIAKFIIEHLTKEAKKELQHYFWTNYLNFKWYKYPHLEINKIEENFGLDGFAVSLTFYLRPEKAYLRCFPMNWLIKTSIRFKRLWQRISK